MNIIKRNKQSVKETEIRLEIPFILDAYGDKDFNECVEIAQQNLQNHLSVIFEHLQILTIQAEETEIETIHYYEAVNTLSILGYGLVQTMGHVLMDAEFVPKVRTKPKSNPLDLTDSDLRGGAVL